VAGIAGDQFHLRDVPKRSVSIVQANEALNFVFDCLTRLERALMKMFRLTNREVLFMDIRKTCKSVEADYSTRMVVRLKDGGTVLPGRNPPAGEYSTLDDAPVNSHNLFEDFVLGDKTRQILPADVPWKILKSQGHWQARRFERVAKLLSKAALVSGVSCRVPEHRKF
jgi:hypothetical protein